MTPVLVNVVMSHMTHVIITRVPRIEGSIIYGRTKSNRIIDHKVLTLWKIRYPKKSFFTEVTWYQALIFLVVQCLYKVIVWTSPRNIVPTSIITLHMTHVIITGYHGRVQKGPLRGPLRTRSNRIIDHKVLTLWKIGWFHHGYLDGIVSSVDILAISTVGLRLKKCYKISKSKMFKMRTSDMFWIHLQPPSSTRPDLINFPDVDRICPILPFTISSIKWPVIVSVTHLVFIRWSLNINTTAIEKITNYIIFATSRLSHQLTWLHQLIMTASPVYLETKITIW